MALNTYQDLTLNTSVFFTSGNHENNTGAMGRYFNYTEKDGNEVKTISGEYYSFDYANAHFTVLDTNDASSDGLGSAQLAWLENDLKIPTRSGNSCLCTRVCTPQARTLLTEKSSQ